MSTQRFSLLIFTFIIVGSLSAQEISDERSKTTADRDALLRMAERFDQKNKIDSLKMEELKARFGESAIMHIGEDGKIAKLVRFNERGFPEFYETHNSNAAITSSTSDVHPGGGAGFSLTGSGIEIGEWDGGAVRATHQELTGRITQVDNPSSNSDHATHVAGTMIATGVNNSAKGMAYQANIKAHDFSNDETEIATYAATSNAIVSNHSYGTITGWYYKSSESAWYWYGEPSISQTEDYNFGYYNYWAYVWDTIANAAPYYLIVKSAGNDRNDNISLSANDTHYVWSSGWTISTQQRAADCPTGYDCISTNGNAKNILTVGAVNDISSGYSQPNDVVMSSFSGWGPTDDGRIKPDIVGNGVSLFSSGAGSNTDYYNSSGTSMSAPNVTGSLALIQEYYDDQNSSFMLSSALKALVIHTANEAGGANGPDYKNGWGLLDTRAAVEHLADTNAILTWANLNNGDSLVYNYYFDGNDPIVATICWNDPAGTPVSAQLDPTTSMLVNDLDLRVINDSSGAVSQPWILNPASPSSAASTGDNFRDNVEKVEISSPDPGFYTFKINHKGTLANAQQVSIVISHKAEAPVACAPTSNTLNPQICQGQTYTSPAGGNYTSAATFNDTLTNAGGCDSVITVNLTVSNPQVTLQTSGTGCGSTTGSIQSTVATGVSPYSYLWSNSATSANISGLSSGTYTVTVTDAAGCTDSESVTLNTTVDNTDPVVVTQNLTVSLDGSGNATITPAQVDNGSSDNCSISSMSLSQTAFDCSDIGSNSVTLTVTDASGNSANGTATITINDNSVPSVTTQNISVSLNASGNVAITASQVNNGSSDNCSIANMSVSPSTFDCSDVGSNTVTLTVTDGSGNLSSETATVTVQDNTNPTANAQSLTVYLNASGNANITATQVNNGSTDNCTGISFSVSPSSFDCSDIGANNVTLTVTDASNNTATANATVTVLDTISPSVSAQNITVYLDGNGEVNVTANQVDNGSDDNCSISSFSLSTTFFTCSETGANSVTLSALDGSGNNGSAQATITVLDTISPNVSGQNVTLYANANGIVMMNGAMLNSGSSDNCGIDFYSVTPSTLSCSNLGVNTVLLNATDLSGNISSTNVQVTVLDTISPQAVAQNLVLPLAANGTAVLDPLVFGSNASDNCGIDSMGVSQTTFDCDDIGNTIPVTLTVYDASGNMSQATGNVVVEDNVNPVVQTVGTTIYLNQNGQAGVSPTMITDTVYDNCALDQVFVSPATFNCTSPSNITVTLYAIDESGNVGSAVAAVSVVDTLPPVISSASPVVHLDANGEGELFEANVNTGTVDNCGMASYELSKTLFTCDDQGENHIVVTATDINGNVSMDSVLVMVVDTFNYISGFVYQENMVSGSNDTVSVNAVSGATYQWGVTNGSVLSQTQNEAVVTYTSGPSAELKLYQTSEMGCIDSTMKKVMVWPLSIDEIDVAQRAYKVFPNPSRDVLNVSLVNGAVDHVDMSILNQMGQIVATDHWNEVNSNHVNTVDVSQLARGVYNLVLEAETGRVVYQVVIQ